MDRFFLQCHFSKVSSIFINDHDYIYKQPPWGSGWEWVERWEGSPPLSLNAHTSLAGVSSFVISLLFPKMALTWGEGGVLFIICSFLLSYCCLSPLPCFTSYDNDFVCVWVWGVSVVLSSPSCLRVSPRLADCLHWLSSRLLDYCLAKTIFSSVLFVPAPFFAEFAFTEEKLDCHRAAFQ